MSDLKLPLDFENKMKGLLNEEWDDFIDCFNNQKYQALRINQLKTRQLKRNSSEWNDAISYEIDKEILQKTGISEINSVPWANHGYYYGAEERPGKHPFHEMGLYYIQEPSAMSAVGLLDVKPGDYVLDLCSAPGGKATQIAAYLQDEGLLVSNEIHPQRCKILAQNIERMGIGNALVTNEDPQGMAGHFPVFFDKILVDAPCSGEGMFRKNPEAMEEWSLSQVLVCADRQAEILDCAAIMLKPGGRMVYSTCTFSPEEDELSIVHFLERHPDFSIVKAEAPYFSKARKDWGMEKDGIEDTFRLWPHKLKGEGHYVAVLEKKGGVVCSAKQDDSADSSEFKKKDKKKAKQQKTNECLNKEQKQSFEEFVADALENEYKKAFAYDRMILFGDQLYVLPKGIKSIGGLKVQRPGLHLGTFKKNRFEPSHALALYLSKWKVRLHCDLSLDDKRVAGFFRGEGVFVAENELFYADDASVTNISKEKGFCLVCVEGYSAGWGKLVNGQIKNYYPKGLRKEF